MDAILGQITPHQRRKKLDEMTKGERLGDAYAATISRIKALQGSRSKLGMDVLMWASHAERPLHVDELCHALGVEEGSREWNTQNIPAIETLLECSLGLVTVEKSSSTVRLVHYTLQEYLSHNPNLFPKPHSVIAEVCLTYLNFPHIRDLSPALRSVPPTAPLVEYASSHWGSHARRGDNKNVKALALELLDGYDNHISSKIQLLRGVKFWGQPFDQENIPRGFTGLHGAAYFGCLEIIVTLLETNNWDAQATDFNGNTAIMWAARAGHGEVVKVLLEWSNVNPNTSNTMYGQTPLSLAARDGHEGAVRILLEWGEVNPDKADKWNRTPLWLAAENGHEGVVGMLLDLNDIDPNGADDWSQTPLLRAAENGHERVVGMLLGRKDINPDKADKQSQTPLLLAAKNGHEGVVRMLLDRNDIDPDKADDWSQTPLSWAAKNGYEGVARMLLEQNGINPNRADTIYGETPLSLAAKNGHEGVVKILLARSDVNPDTTDREYGQTPLSRAAENGRAEVVRVLLKRDDVNPNKVDKWNRTPLSWALENGHEVIANLLKKPPDSIPKHAASLQPMESLSPEPSNIFKPLPKGFTGFDIQGQNPTLPSLRTTRILSAVGLLDGSKILCPPPAVHCTLVGKFQQMQNLWITCLEYLLVSLAPSIHLNPFPFIITILLGFCFVNLFYIRARWCISLLHSLYIYTLLVLFLLLILVRFGYSTSLNH